MGSTVEAQEKLLKTKPKVSRKAAVFLHMTMQPAAQRTMSGLLQGMRFLMNWT